MENSTSLQRIKVIHSEHSKFDCLPLRFGVIPPCDKGEIEGYENVAGTQNQKPIEIKNGSVCWLLINVSLEFKSFQF